MSHPRREGPPCIRTARPGPPFLVEAVSSSPLCGGKRDGETPCSEHVGHPLHDQPSHSRGLAATGGKANGSPGAPEPHWTSHPSRCRITECVTPPRTGAKVDAAMEDAIFTKAGRYGPLAQPSR